MTFSRNKVHFVAPLLLAGLLLTGCTGGNGTEETTDEEISPDLITGLSVGTCANLEDLRQSPIEFPAGDCDSAHDAEVVGLIDVSGDELPPVVELEELGQQECAALLGEYISEGSAESELTVYWIRPTQEQWDNGVREMPCIATADTPWEGRL